jgi:membrane-bound lytic murein transglycosylase A
MSMNLTLKQCAKIIFGSILLTLLSCQRAPIEEASEALRVARKVPVLQDDLLFEGLAEAVDQKIEFLEQRFPGNRDLVFGQTLFTVSEYLSGLRHFQTLLKTIEHPELLFAAIKSDFDFYEVYGRNHWGEIFLTSYYEPVIPGSREKTDEFSQALYRTPSDLVEVSLSDFSGDFGRYRVLRGRISPGRTLAGNQQLVPYFDRREIDGKERLKGKGLELAWVDPVDAFFLQIQGSGTVTFSDGDTLRVGYAQQNGQRYEALGKFLTHAIPLREMSLQRIETYLRQQSRSQIMEYLYKNPSYVFFRELDTRPITSIGAEVIDGRTIATDRRYFPKGTLAFMSFEKPVFKSSDILAPPDDWESVGRFVFDQDVGGAIRGTGRVDLFWGSGDEAKRYAGVMKGTGRLYYMAPKRELSLRILQEQKN